MKKVMFTKHLEGWDLRRIIQGIREVGLDGADLCTRPGFPVTPENCEKALPEAARMFAEAGLGIEICTTPVEFTSPDDASAERLFAACGAAGIPIIKLGYWMLAPDKQDYWALLARCRKSMEGFARLSEKHGPRAVVHNHSGYTMGLNSSAAMRIVEGLDPRHAGIFFDAGHLSIVGEPLPMALAIAQKYIACLALKDVLWQKEVGYDLVKRTLKVAPFGYGLVEWPALIREMKRIGLDKPLSFHCEYSGYPPEAVVHQCQADVCYWNALWEKT